MNHAQLHSYAGSVIQSAHVYENAISNNRWTDAMAATTDMLRNLQHVMVLIETLDPQLIEATRKLIIAELELEPRLASEPMPPHPVAAEGQVSSTPAKSSRRKSSGKPIQQGGVRSAASNEATSQQSDASAESGQPATAGGSDNGGAVPS